MPKELSRDHHHSHRRESPRVCLVCSNGFSSRDVLPTALVNQNVAALIAAKVPEWSVNGFICRICLNKFRMELVRTAMEQERGELTTLEQDVMNSLRAGEVVADNLNLEFNQALTLGERLADRVADFGGSWRFIGIFFSVMATWVTANSLYLLWRPFDPYPYILLNLALSLLAAVQAPVIMMSQNRQEARDRLRAENDYKVNLKAELEIRAISDKVDQLIHHQWAHLLEIQEIQMRMIDDLVAKGPPG